MSADLLISKDWYNSLVEDCQAILTEAVFDSRWRLLEGYHQLGTRILHDRHNFTKAEIYGSNITKRVAESIGKSERTVELAMQFAKKFKTIDELPDGKNMSWHKVCKYVLPNHDEDGEPLECRHAWETVKVCTKCGKKDGN